MPSPIFTTDTLAAARSQYYNGKGFLALVSNRVVFQAEVDVTPTGNDFGSVTFTNVTTGAYTDIREGMVVIVSTTVSNYTSAPSTDRYRVRKPPTSSVLYISEASDSMPSGTIITVLNTYDLREKARRAEGVDFDLPFEDLGAVFTGIDSAYGAVTLTPTFTLALSPVAIAMAEGDSIDPDTAYEWEFDQTPTYNTGGAASREIEVELPVETEWGRCTATTVNGIKTWFAFSLHFGDPETDPRFSLCHEPVAIDAAAETGYSASTTAFANYDTVMDRTRCAVIVEETYGGSPDPGFGTVRFVGYLSKDTNATRGSEKGVTKSSQIEMDGLKSLAGLVSTPPIAIRNVTPPTEWDQIANPTTERVIAHLALRYSLLANLCSIVFPGFTDTPAKWAGGNFDITDTSLMDAIKTVGSEINGELNSDAAGGFVFERHGSFLSTDERNALPTVVPEALNSGDQFELQLVRDHRPRVGKVEMGARMFFSDGRPSIGYTAMAPAVAYGEGQERVTIPNALLPADDLANANSSAGLRAAYWYAFKNNTITLNTQLTDGFGCLSPSNAQWWPFDIAARDTTRGIVITSATRWLLQSVRTVINANGVQDVSPVWIPETTPGRAMILVAVSPSVALTELPVVPTRAAYGAFPPKPSINYTTTDPTNKQRRDPFSGWQTSPWPSKQAADAALKQGKPGCRRMDISFRNPAAVNTGFITTLDATYPIHFSGIARASVSWEHTGNFKLLDEGFVPNASFPYGTWSSGAGWITTDAYNAIVNVYWRGIDPEKTLSTTLLTYVKMVYDWTSGSHFALDQAAGIEINGVSVYSKTNTELTNGTNKVAEWTGAVAASVVRFIVHTSVQTTASYSGSAAITSFTMRGEGDNPFGGATDALYKDAFYKYNKDADGNPVNVVPNTSGGVRIDNNGITVFPPFNSNGEYDVLLSDFNGTGGTGSVLAVKFLDADYSDTQPALLSTTICGPGAGQ